MRMRIDGALIEYMQLPRTLHQPLIARIKILAGLDIAEHRLPQDGHFRAHSEEGGGVNLRVSVMPTVFGEKAVLPPAGGQRGHRPTPPILACAMRSMRGSPRCCSGRTASSI